eukprot:2656474-Prymnesium_polylepis.1
MHAAQVERLVVMPAHRRRGAKEVMFGVCCDAYHAIGLPVRVKTGAHAVHEAFVRCQLLAYEGHRPPGKANG